MAAIVTPVLAGPASAYKVVIYETPPTEVFLIPQALFGDAGKKLRSEADRAASSYRGLFYGQVGSTTPPGKYMLDPTGSRDALAAYAKGQGVDFADLINAAASHFTSPIRRRTDPLSAAELESLLEDDQHSFDR